MPRGVTVLRYRSALLSATPDNRCAAFAATGAPRDGEPKDGPALKHVDSKGLIKVPAKKKQKEVRRSSMDALKGLCVAIRRSAEQTQPQLLTLRR